MEVPWEEASRFGLMVADENDKITEFQEKPKQPTQQQGGRDFDERVYQNGYEVDHSAGTKVGNAEKKVRYYGKILLHPVRCRQYAAQL